MVWPRTHVEDGNISHSVWALRKLLQRPDYPDPIQTVPRRGYLFAADVRPRLREIHAGQELRAREIPRPLPLIGRGHESTILMAKLKSARASSGSVILMEGDAGTGKTRMGEDLMREARRQGFTTLTGRSHCEGGAPPYAAFAEILEDYARATPRAGWLRSVGEAGPELACLMPELRRRFPEPAPPDTVPAGTRRAHLLNAYRSFLTRVCRAKPVLILLENLHCADDSTLWLFRHLTLGIASLRCVVYVTYRGRERASAPYFAETLSQLARIGGVSRIQLRNLSRAAVRDVLSAVNGEFAPPALALLVFQLTAGNPFLIEEILVLLNSEGRLFNSAGGWTSTAGPDWVDLPPAIRARLDGAQTR